MDSEKTLLQNKINELDTQIINLRYRMEQLESLVTITSLSLVDNNLNSQKVIIPGTSLHGAYIVIIEDMNESGGTKAIFALSRCSGSTGSVHRIVNSIGYKGEEILIVWNHDYPRLYWAKIPSDACGNLIQFKVQTIKTPI